MNRLLPAALLLVATVAGVRAQPVAPHVVEGVALKLPGRSEAYVERHTIGALEHRIEYRAPDGTPIARLALDYRCSDSAPAFEQHDLRNGARIGARWQDGAYLLQHGDETRALAPSATLVASSGFDRFVRENWDALAAGRSLELDFALPARLQTLRLRIARVEAPEALPGAALWLRIVAAQPLLRAFVEPIELAYGGDRGLLLYRGLSNLAGADGKAQSVEIRYRALPAAEPGPEREIAANAPQTAEPGADGRRRTADATHCPGESS